jgi:signal transduction histidine kinase
MKLPYLILLFSILVSSCTETKKEEFELNSFHKDWVRLTEKEGKLIVFNSCDAGNLLLSISQKNNHFNLLLHGEQEDSDFEILESNQNNDTVILKTKDKETNENQNFKFIWVDREKGLGRWLITFPNGHTIDHFFVISDKQTKFDIITQPCEECWGEECEELK